MASLQPQPGSNLEEVGKDGFPRADSMQSLFEKSKNDKVFAVKEWDLALAMLRGQQWLRWSGDKSRWIEDTTKGNSSRRTRATFNLILNFYRNIIARLEVAFPSVSVMPATTGSDDIAKAKANEVALHYYWQQARLRDVFNEAAHWLVATGSVALHTFVDGETKTIQTEALSPYDVFFEPGVRAPENSQWIALRRRVRRDILADAFPQFRKEIMAAPNSQRDLGEGVFTGTSRRTDGPSDRVDQFDLYMWDGRHTIIVGDTNLWKEEVPIANVPVQFIRYTELPRELWGVGLIKPLIGPQIHYNTIRSHILENARQMGHPKWLIDQGSNVSPRSITNAPGEKITYVGRPPTPIPAPELPAYVMNNVPLIHSEMQDIAGLHSTSLGKRAVGVSSGKAIEALSSRDSSQLSITQAHIENGFKELAETVLQFMKVYYDEPRMMRMFDQTGQVMHRMIQSADIVEDPEVFIVPGTLFRDDAIEREQRVMGMLEAQLLTPEEAKRHLEDRTLIFDKFKRLEGLAHARDMLEAAKLGAAIEIFLSDDLDAFEEVFGQFARSPEFYELDPDTQERIRNVIVTLAARNATDEAFLRLQGQAQVFPRQVAPVGRPPQTGPAGLPVLGQISQPQPNLSPDEQSAQRSEGLIGTNLGAVG